MTRKKWTSLRSYARHIGLAFQVIDDMLNVSGDPAKLGKAVGTDTVRGKNTFPGLMGMAKTAAFAENLVQSALKALALLITRQTRCAPSPVTSLTETIINSQGPASISE